MRLPDAAALVEGAAALEVALDRSQADRLLAFMALLMKWNRAINLTARDDPAAVLSLHILDCLGLVAPLRRHGSSRTLLDVGSGAGLPGIVVAVAMPEVQVTCVDAVAKKATFVRQAASELELPSLTALHGRVESIGGTFDVVASRAFASLADFVQLTRARLAPDGVWLAMKGKRPTAELEELPEGISFHVEPLNIPLLAAERCLVWMKPIASERALTSRIGT